MSDDNQEWAGEGAVIYGKVQPAQLNEMRLMWMAKHHTPVSPSPPELFHCRPRGKFKCSFGASRRGRLSATLQSFQVINVEAEEVEPDVWYG